MKIKGLIKNLKIKKKLKNDNSKIYLLISLEVLRAVCDQFSFRQFLVPPYTSQSLQVPSNVVSVNYRVLICCTCHFQCCSLFFVYFGFLCLQVPSVSNFRPDTRGQKWSFIQALFFTCAAGRKERCKRISLARVGSARSVWITPGLPRSQRVCFPSLHCSGSRLLCRELSEAALGCVRFPDLRRSGSGSRVLHKGEGSAGPAFCARASCRSQVRAAQVTKCLASAHSPSAVRLSTSPAPAAQFPGCTAAAQVCHVSLLGS